MNPIPSNASAIKQEIKIKVVELAKRLGVDARDLSDRDVIPERAGLDSAAIMELIVWYETKYGIEVDQDDLTLDNFGTIEAMATYLHGRARV